MFEKLITELGAWSWFIVGFVLLIVEVLTPGTVFFLWLALSALFVGIMAFSIDMGWQAQWLLFSCCSLLSLTLWHKWFKHKFKSTQDNASTLNNPTSHFIGQTYILAEPIQNGKGRLKIGDTYWRIEGNDAPAGKAVKITSADGALLKVEIL